MNLNWLNSMKNFDLAAAKAGAPVCTRDGRGVVPVAVDYLLQGPYVFSGIIGFGDDYPYKRIVETWTEDGLPTDLTVGECNLSLMMRDDDYAEKLAREEYGPTVKEKLTVDTPTCKDSLPVDRVAWRREFAEKAMLKIIDGIVCHNAKNFDDNRSIYSSAAYDAVSYADALITELETKKTKK